MGVTGSLKVDILIKSFNRAFYLDRCLQSLYLNVQNVGKIYVLDDGTPNKYLEKINQKFPEVIILTSAASKEKAYKIENNLAIDGYRIPSDLWVNAVKKASDYFLMIEDDVWFTATVDLNEIASEMKEYKIELTKLGWQGNTKYLYNFREKKLNKLYSQYSKGLFLSGRNIMSCLLENKFKLLSILCRIGLANNQTVNEYYNYISILMGLYHKNFWLYTWQDSKGRVKEKDLLKNAVAYVHKHKKNKNIIARTSKECLKTTYISSATNSYHKTKEGFDIMFFNKLLNEQWYKGVINSMQNYPLDFTPDYLLMCTNNTIDKNKYFDWISEFKDQFRQSGAHVE